MENTTLTRMSRSFQSARSSTWFAILVVSMAAFTDMFVYAIIIPIAPSALAQRVGTEQRSVQSSISLLLMVYGAANLVTAPFCGWLTDLRTRRRLPFLLGLLALCASTVLLCVGSSMPVLLVGRALQGASATVVWVVGLALLVDHVGAQAIGRAMGCVGLSTSAATAFTPLLAGAVFARFGYYATYGMAFAVIAVDIVMRLAMIERPIVAVRSQGLSPSQSMSVEGKNVPPSPAAISSKARTRSSPKLPPILLLLSSPRLLCALWASLINACLVTAFDSILPNHVRDIFGWDSLGAGLAFLPLCVPTFLGPLIGSLSDRHGPRRYVVGGFLFAFGGLLLLRLVKHDNLEQKVLMCVLLTLIGTGFALMGAPLMAEIAYAVVEKAANSESNPTAQAYGLFNMAWAGGSMVGPLLASSLIEVHGWADMTLVLGLVSLHAALLSAVLIGGNIIKKSHSGSQA